jgi:hypothetical protein
MVFIPPHFVVSTYDQVLRTYPVRKKSVSTCTAMVQPGDGIAEYAESAKFEVLTACCRRFKSSVKASCVVRVTTSRLSKGPQPLPSCAW